MQELALVQGIPRQSTVVAIDAVELMGLDVEVIVSQYIRHVLKTSFEQRNKEVQFSSNPLFSSYQLAGCMMLRRKVFQRYFWVCLFAEFLRYFHAWWCEESRRSRPTTVSQVIIKIQMIEHSVTDSNNAC
jgi:hypothetical protein